VDAPGHDDMVDHVLGRFKPGERAVIENAVATAAQGVELWVHQGIQECMNRYNGEPGA
jgi:peptidyl-tRNA hydrolase, PTH1 family